MVASSVLIFLLVQDIEAFRIIEVIQINVFPAKENLNILMTHIEWLPGMQLKHSVQYM